MKKSDGCIYTALWDLDGDGKADARYTFYWAELGYTAEEHLSMRFREKPIYIMINKYTGDHGPVNKDRLAEQWYNTGIGELGLWKDRGPQCYVCGKAASCGSHCYEHRGNITDRHGTVSRNGCRQR